MKILKNEMNIRLYNELNDWKLADKQITAMIAEMDRINGLAQPLKGSVVKHLFTAHNGEFYYVKQGGPGVINFYSLSEAGNISRHIVKGKISHQLNGISFTFANVPTVQDETNLYEVIEICRKFSVQMDSLYRSGSDADTTKILASAKTAIKTKYKTLSSYMYVLSNTKSFDWTALKVGCELTGNTAPAEFKKPDVKPAEWRSGYSKIVKVLEFPNTNERLAVLEHYGHEVNWRGSKHSTEHTWLIAESTEELYNYLDEGRWVIMDTKNVPGSYSSYSYYRNLSEWSGGLRSAGMRDVQNFSYPKVVFTEDNPPLDMINPEINLYHKLMDSVEFKQTRLVLLNNTDARKKLALLSLEAQRIQAREQQLVAQEKSMKDSFSRATVDKPVNLNGVSYYADRAEYEGETLSSDRVQIPTLIQSLVDTFKATPQHVNFDLLFDNFVNEAIAKATLPGEQTLKIGQVVARLEAKQSATTKNTGGATRFYVNDRRINKAEVIEVLKKAVCFNSQVQFDSFCESVSKCSIEMHYILSEGLDVTIVEDRQNWKIKLKFKRKANRTYLVAGTDEIAVHDMRTIISNAERNDKHTNGRNYYYGSRYDLEWFLKQLEDPKVVGITDHNKVLSIIKDGKQAYVDAQKKSEELLKQAEKVLKILPSTEVINGHRLTGYVIKGLSGNSYFVDGDDHRSDQYHGKPYPVYTFPQGQAICIVDKASSHAQVGKDALVNRLFALKNDKLVTSEITTLKI